MFKKVIILFLLLIPLRLLNSQLLEANVIPIGGDGQSIPKTVKQDKSTLFKKTENLLELKSEADYGNYIQQINSSRKVDYGPQFNLVSSFQKNIRWGGFKDGYAIVNFTPDMYIQPFDFISIYASHNYSNYIPISKIKENIKPLILEGAVILAIDNVFKFLFSFNPIIVSFADFAVKNLAITLIKNSLKSQNKYPENKYYFYSVRIKF